MEMNRDVNKQLYNDLIECSFFSISLDETTDATSNARLAIIARCFNGDDTRENLV
jgi:hypothetical protein